jgi:hypothetical protein
MPNLTIPVDGRRQYSLADVAMANASLGRMPLTGVEQVGPDRYVIAGSWPQPPTTNRWSGGGGGMSSRPVEPEAAPRSSASARAVWPNLR